MSQLDGETSTQDLSLAAKGKGGVRPGAGRPRTGIFAALQGDREYAKNLINLVMRDHSQPVAIRVRCAIAILVRGKPSNNGKRPAFYRDDPPLKANTNPEGNQADSGGVIPHAVPTTPDHS